MEIQIDSEWVWIAYEAFSAILVSIQYGAYFCQACDTVTDSFRPLAASAILHISGAVINTAANSNSPITFYLGG